MKGLLRKMSEKQWTPFYVDLDPCESDIWPVQESGIVDKKNSKPTQWILRGVLPKMAYTGRLHSERGTIFRLQVYKWEGTLSFRLVKMPQKG